MVALAALFAGLLFGVGLIVAGMVDPSKVLAFLDLMGAWDPSLALVMAAALAIGSIGFALARRRETSLLGEPMRLPSARRIDRRLIVGSTLFGMGWGLVGYCPGPALTALGMGEPKAVLFLGAMLAGMGLYEELERRRLAPPATQAR